MSKSKKSDTEKPAKPKKAEKAGKPEKAKKAEGKKKNATKAVVGKAPGKTRPATSPAPAKLKKAVAPAPAITLDDISLRAYFIAERRQAMGWPGDPTSDWIEAERQLKAEASRKTKR